MTDKSNPILTGQIQILSSGSINSSFSRHPKCRGYRTQDVGWGSEFECGYETIIDCDECKYGRGRKNPEAKCNQDYR